MAEVVLDANVIVALLYADDSQHQRAVDLTTLLESEGHSIVLVDILVFEALSVSSRRFGQSCWFRSAKPMPSARAIGHPCRIGQQARSGDTSRSQKFELRRAPF